LLTSVGSSAIVLEPVFFWPDALKDFHKRNVEAEHLKKIKGFPEDLAARKFVAALRKDLTDICLSHKAVHFQIGKTYPYQDGVSRHNIDLVAAIKKHIDPDNQLNPGALGFER